ncbi:MAG: hypoxanthine phosphoribosyltransferase [Saprospiraceae bacterium]|nr:hypoxanthine phosphoribosyltransferase [Saprospiraceae bacterium]MBP7699482.1 hypoxanthine phosphoribosyltransferase [Saprospiraceae bacterium]
MITIHDRPFQPYINRTKIAERIQALAIQLRADYADTTPYFIGLLNGAFIFTADLVRAFGQPCYISFTKLSSYQGLSSGGEVHTLIGLEKSISGKHLVIVEDIIDSGKTLHHFLQQLQATTPASVRIATLLYKPDAVQYQIPINYCGFEIPNKFVIGYGLDYDGLGRQLPDIYQLAAD